MTTPPAAGPTAWAPASIESSSRGEAGLAAVGVGAPVSAAPSTPIVPQAAPVIVQAESTSRCSASGTLREPVSRGAAWKSSMVPPFRVTSGACRCRAVDSCSVWIE